MSKTLRTLSDLAKTNFISRADIANLKAVADDFAISITPAMIQLVDLNDQNDPIKKQFIPTIAEKNISPAELIDPIGDTTFSPVKGIIHRYPDRLLLTPLFVCPVYCRFCFRKNKVSQSKTSLTINELALAIEYIATHQEIWEVIITGGDPLFLKPASLKKIIVQLNLIRHVAVIRLHTPVPIVAPERINADLLSALASQKTLYVAIHANHAREFSLEAKDACKRIFNSGIAMISQSVLLKDINDNVSALSELMRTFVINRIKPYYLHHGDLVKGAKHFRVSLATGKALMKALRGHYSGLCQPTYVVDIPGGHGKIPITHQYIIEAKTGFIIEDYLENKHTYHEDVY